MPERVLQLLGPSTGGIRRHVGALAAALAARGWGVVVAGPAGAMDGIRPLDLVVPIPATLRPLGLLTAVRHLRDASDGVALVHAHGLKAGWVAVASSRTRRRRAPVVVTVHNLILDETSWAGGAVHAGAGAQGAQAGRRPGGGLARGGRLCPSAHVASGPGDPAVGAAREARRPREEVRARLGAGAGQALVVCVARLHPQKGLPTLIEAAALLAGRGVALRVAIIGEGPLAGELGGLIRSRELEAVVVLAGPSDNAPDELAAADVVVIPSVWESGPLVLAEALALSRPVVATPVGLVPEVIHQGVGGRIVPVGDARALADAVAALLADPGAAATMAAAGRQAVEQVLGAEALVDATEELYRELLVRR